MHMTTFEGGWPRPYEHTLHEVSNILPDFAIQECQSQHILVAQDYLAKPGKVLRDAAKRCLPLTAVWRKSSRETAMRLPHCQQKDGHCQRAVQVSTLKAQRTAGTSTPTMPFSFPGGHCPQSRVPVLFCAPPETRRRRSEKESCSSANMHLIKTEYWDRAGGGGNISYDW